MVARDAVRAMATPLRREQDLDPLLERIGDARVVMLGEASHGTHEFYAWRAALTRRLVEEVGVGFVAVEGDWPDCYRLGRCVTGAPDAPEDPLDVLCSFDRWPRWMWANSDVLDLARWLRERNARVPEAERVGFYGLDVYSLWESLHILLGYLQEHEPEHVPAALEAVRCFEPFQGDVRSYARATRLSPAGCEDDVVRLLSEVRRTAAQDGGAGVGDERFAAEQNARAVAGAEAYYRQAVRGGPGSWNVRDRHMADTLDALLSHHEQQGRPARAVVWEHNTHVGDARATDMVDAGMVNLGQLAREAYGEDDVVLVGFATHRGSVVAAEAWGAPAEEMPLPAARSGTLEELLHEALPDMPAALLLTDGDGPDWLRREVPHRAVGVVYHPEAERLRNYVPTVVGRRYDALLWLNETTALTPLHRDAS